MTKSPTIDPERDGWTRHAPVPFLQMLGSFWRKEVDGHMHYGFQLEPRHANHRENAHGGLMATLMDHTLGMTASEAAGSSALVTAQLDVQFIAAASAGEFIVGRGELLRRTSQLMFLRGVLTVGDRVVMAGSGVWKAVKPRG